MAHKILILDDEEQLLRMMQDLLSARGYEVDAASTPREAKNLLANSKYSVAILDLGLSQIDRTDGLDMVSHVRKRSPGTKIIVFTGNDNPDVKRLANRLGADLYLVKPGPIRKLGEAVAEFCGGVPDQT
jgi:DNA-binding response OmpR family regulator